MLVAVRLLAGLWFGLVVLSFGWAIGVDFTADLVYLWLWFLVACGCLGVDLLWCLCLLQGLSWRL